MAKDNPQSQCPFGSEHGEFKKAIERLEANVSELWGKWNKMQGWLIGIWVTLTMNLLGVIIGVIMIYLRSSR